MDVAQQTAELIEQTEGTETDNSEVVFAKQGYTIGLGEQMLKVMAKVK